MKKRFEELYQKYRDTVYGYLYYMCREDELARDLTQETFLKIFLGLRKFRGECSEKTWCLAIARNVFLSYARKKQPLLLGEELLEIQENADENMPEQHVIQQEEGKLVRQILAQLAEDERTLLLLKDYEDIPCAELARMMGLTESNIKVKLHRIRQKYRKLYLQKIRQMEGR